MYRRRARARNGTIQRTKGQYTTKRPGKPQADFRSWEPSAIVNDGAFFQGIHHPAATRRPEIAF